MGIGMKRVTALNGTCCNFMHKPDDIDVRFGWSLSSGSQELLLRRNVRFYSMEYTAGEQLGRRRGRFLDAMNRVSTAERTLDDFRLHEG